ncbi:MAG: DUF1599 domain-containing protein [Segetibacter sp.]|jgi:hypothetical protein|nr:DUF1599 domain-containing protein [Segetibacter sp.]
MHTLEQYDEAINSCREVFIKKVQDYGTSWRVLRMISIVDQIYIKALRIRTIQEKKHQKIADDIPGEFIGMANYAVIALIQIDMGTYAAEDLPVEEAARLYDAKTREARELMQNKNHDYGEAWRDMSQQSFVDLILMKLLRIKQILTNDGKTIISEGIDANFTDIINYSIFGLILIGEGKH